MGGGEILLLPLIVQRKKLRHRPSISLGQEGILAAGIISLFDGDCLKKAFPQRAVLHLGLIRACQRQGVYSYDF